MAIYGHTTPNSVKKPFPLGKWVAATTGERVDNEPIAYRLFGATGLTQTLFDLDNSGLSIACVGMNSSTKHIGTFYNNSGTIVENNYNETNKPVRALQYKTSPQKIAVLDENGVLAEYDFTSVLEADGNPTKTVLLSGIEGASFVNSSIELADFDMKWIGENDDKLLLFHRGSTVFTVLTLQETSGTWALVDKETVTGLTTFSTREQCLCSKQNTDIDSDHWFNCLTGVDIFGALVNLDGSLNITITAYGQNGSNVEFTGEVSGLLFCHLDSGSNFQQHYWDKTGTGSEGIVLLNSGVSSAGYDLTTYWPIVSDSNIFAKAVVDSDSADYLFFSTAAGVTRSWNSFLNGVGGTYFPSKSGILFTGTDDDPYKFLWSFQGKSGPDSGHVTLCEI